MVRLTDIGPKGYKRGAAVATLTFTPNNDRESVVCYVNVTAVSAADTWRISVGSREIMAFVENTTGNQQLLGGSNANFPKARNLFRWFEEVYGRKLTIPVPNGQSMVIKSDGGATADIFIEYEDYTIGTVPRTAVNHYLNNDFVVPMFASLSSSPTTAGEKLLDTFVQPTWMTNVFAGTQFPTSWEARIVAMFLEAAARNTYSGTADHLSSINYLAFIQDGQRLFTHDVDGIPIESSAAASGSANTVYGANPQPFPAFQNIVSPTAPVLDVPFMMRGGDNIKAYVNLAGDLTGGAAYTGALMVALVEYRQVS